MLIYNLIEHSNNYSKTFGSLWKYYRTIPAVNDNGDIVAFAENNLTYSLNFKVKITGQTENNETKVVEIMVSLKYRSNFCRTLDIPLTNC